MAPPAEDTPRHRHRQRHRLGWRWRWLSLGVALAILGSLAATALLATVWTPADPLALTLSARLAPPSAAFPLGTDEFGRDQLSRLMVGARSSVTIALSTVALALGAGVAIGMLAGFLRGVADRVVMALTDALLAFPGILLALGLVTVTGPTAWGIVLALSIAYLPVVIRVVRSAVLSLREREFIEASVALGNGLGYTLRVHILPNAVAPITVLATSLFGWIVLAESALSFLGLGVRPPAPSWGNMLSAARPYLETAPWLGIAPGLCITLTLLAVNLLGDALRDRLDPQLAESGQR